MDNDLSKTELLDAINKLSDRFEEKSVKLEETAQDTLLAVHEFSKSVDERFEKLENDVNTVKDDVMTVKDEVHVVKSTMVTKNYLDEKLSDLRGDLSVFIRKEPFAQGV